MFSQAARVAARSTRTLSTSATALAEAPAKAPIQVFGVNGRYAHALFSAASKKKVLPQVEKELKEVKARVNSDAAFANFLQNPVLSRSQKAEAARAMMTNKKYSEVTRNFFGVLAENNRLPQSKEIIAAFEEIMAATRSEVACKVVSAQTLSSSVQSSVEKALAKLVQSGQKTKVTYETDPTLLGGFQVEIGDKFVDLSVRTKVQHYTNILSQNL